VRGSRDSSFHTCIGLAFGNPLLPHRTSYVSSVGDFSGEHKPHRIGEHRRLGGSGWREITIVLILLDALTPVNLYDAHCIKLFAGQWFFTESA